jgi:hypothetical protein
MWEHAPYRALAGALKIRNVAADAFPPPKQNAVA